MYFNPYITKNPSSFTETRQGVSPWECLGSHLRRRVAPAFFSSHWGILNGFLLSPRDKQLSYLVLGRQGQWHFSHPCREEVTKQPRFHHSPSSMARASRRTVGIAVGTGPALPAIGHPGRGRSPPSPALCRQQLFATGARALRGRWCPKRDCWQVAPHAALPSHTLMCVQTHV